MAMSCDPLLAEQLAYYRAIAPEYEDHALPGPGEGELIAALDAFRPTGDVLELACADLEERLRRLGWDVTVTATSAPCYWGEGTLAASAAP